MANTYTQIYIQLIFAVKHRESLISASWKGRLHKYITGIVQNKKNKLIAINSMPDHIHIFIGLNPENAISDLVRDIKKDTTNFINNNIKLSFKFAWQEGYGAFSYSHSQIDYVVKYIVAQEKHHKKQTFRQEYEQFLQKFAIKYVDCYNFKWITDE